MTVMAHTWGKAVTESNKGIVTETLGVGNGVVTRILHAVRRPVSPGSVVITFIQDGSPRAIRDDKDGNLVGDVHASGTNAVAYQNGRMDATCVAAPDKGTAISLQYSLLASPVSS